ncbi:hypothetical protein GCM10020331_018700 [Ectobacillus funiculus]
MLKKDGKIGLSIKKRLRIVHRYQRVNNSVLVDVHSALVRITVIVAANPVV